MEKATRGPRTPKSSRPRVLKGHRSLLDSQSGDEALHGFQNLYLPRVQMMIEFSEILLFIDVYRFQQVQMVLSNKPNPLRGKSFLQMSRTKTDPLRLEIQLVLVDFQVDRVSILGCPGVFNSFGRSLESQTWIDN